MAKKRPKKIKKAAKAVSEAIHKVGDNFLDKNNNRVVLKSIEEADPSLGINNRQYIFGAPGEILSTGAEMPKNFTKVDNLFSVKDLDDFNSMSDNLDIGLKKIQDIDKAIMESTDPKQIEHLQKIRTGYIEQNLMPLEESLNKHISSLKEKDSNYTVHSKTQKNIDKLREIQTAQTSNQTTTQATNQTTNAQQSTQQTTQASTNNSTNNNTSNNTNNRKAEKEKRRKKREKMEKKIKEQYKTMSPEDKEIFRNKFREKFATQKIDDYDTVGNAQALRTNEITLQRWTNKDDNPLLNADRELSNEIKNSLNTGIEKGKKYFSNLKDTVFDGKDTVQDLGAYGDLVNILTDKDMDNSIKHVITKELGLDGNILNADLGLESLGEKKFGKQLDSFIGKTYKKGEDVEEYMKRISPYLDVNADDDMYKRIQDRVSSKGNILQKLNKSDQKALKRERELEKLLSENIPDDELIKRRNKLLEQRADNKIISTSEKKKAKKLKKAEKKEMSKLRIATETEGGTLTDFFKGYRGNLLNVGMSTISAISDYKEGRNQGKTVLGASADAALSFAASEVIGFPGMLGLMAIKGTASLAVKGSKYVIESSRSMNNIQRFTPFADAQFQDTQQLATMRQSGMELAKMSQYNLQQTLMGTEARHLHR